MAKYDDTLNRMSFLMEYDNSDSKKNNSNIEFSAKGADGLVYGILKEGTKYYIKTTEPGKEMISESYNYINGATYRKENEFSSYNEATKQLELKLMSLNEAYGKNTPTSTVDFKHSEKVFANLTNEARTELNRMNAIFENACNIGKADCICDPESKGEATAEDTEENNDPFKTPVTVKDNDGELEVNAKTDGDEMKDVSKEVEKNLTSDKAPKAEDSTKEDYEDAHSDLEGESVAEKLNEDVNTDDIAGLPAEEEVVDTEDFEEPNGDESIEDIVDSFEDNAEADDEENELDTLLESVEAELCACEKIEEVPEEVKVEEHAEKESEETLKNFKAKGTLPVQSVETISEAVYEKLLNKLAEKKLADKINKMVNEEIANLGVFGAHPAFRKEPMTTPKPETATDSSVEDVEAKSAGEDKPFATKIGDGKPFSEKVINILTDQVMARIKESLKK